MTLFPFQTKKYIDKSYFSPEISLRTAVTFFMVRSVETVTSVYTTPLKKKVAPYFELMNKKKKLFEHFSVELI